ncbi:hypothetical protein RMN57_13225 [Kitasatospora sp. CM 4170]|uniref:Uncharacterized protein n=1 Tax=Kitasatospora aburaviensis TaxID=67265 RepID=A0ABW1ER26_9ACTN|nr:hypothetical protein [Kitasatospora sp. CM 4170]WNM45616.1 hypothetical protein RMN57_13225 [Kitasatospora sp. CM 4170]
MRYLVQAPRVDFNGEVAGVRFADGAATLDTADQMPALGYFQRAGYVLAPLDEPAEQPTKPTPKARQRAAETEQGAQQ